jgi:hypothetical protein
MGEVMKLKTAKRFLARNRVKVLKGYDRKGKELPTSFYKYYDKCVKMVKHGGRYAN